MADIPVFVNTVLQGRHDVHMLNYALCKAVDTTKTVQEVLQSSDSKDLLQKEKSQSLLRKNFHTTSRRVCCYMFKVGDLAFNCAQCQTHKTCVLCEKCFGESNHEGHDITFFRVRSVGGCCDCGDVTAWKPEGFCSHHGKTLELQQIFCDSSQRTWIRSILSAAIKYITQTLQAIHPENPHSGENNCDIVVRGVDKMMNVNLSAKICTMVEFSAQQKQQLIETDKVAVLTNVQIIEPLKYLCRCLKKYCHVNLQDNGLLESEQYCCQILAWFCSLCDVSEGFTISLAEILSEEQSILAAQMPKWMEAKFLMSCSSTSTALRKRGVFTPLWSLMYTEGYTTTTLRKSIHSLYIQLLGLPKFKDQFAIDYACIYPLIGQDICTGAIRRKQSLLVLGVQFLNRRNFVNRLVKQHNLMHSIVQCTHEFLLSLVSDPTIPNWVTVVSDKGRKHRKVLNLQHELVAHHDSCLFFLSTDMSYCLAHADDARDFCRDKVLFSKWLEILALADDMCIQRRMCHSHVEITLNTWEKAFNMELMLLNLSGHILRWIALADPKSDDAFIADVVAVLVTFLHRLDLHTDLRHQEKQINVPMNDSVTSNKVQALNDDFKKKATEGDTQDFQSYQHSSDSDEHETARNDDHSGAYRQWLNPVAPLEVGPSKSPVFSSSFHRPLQRALAIVIRCVAAVDDEEGTLMLSILKQVAEQCGWDLLSQTEFRTMMRRMFHPSLKVLLFHSQISAGLWVRNGTAMISQNTHYAKIESFFGNDIVSCQFWILALVYHQFDIVERPEKQPIVKTQSDMSDLSSWTIDQVQNQLKKWNLDVFFGNIFLNMQIDGDFLLHDLQPEDITLSKCSDFTTEGHKRKLFRKINELKSGAVTSDLMDSLIVATTFNNNDDMLSDREDLMANDCTQEQKPENDAMEQEPELRCLDNVLSYFYQTFCLTFNQAGFVGYEFRGDETPKFTNVTEHAQVLLRAVVTRIPQFAREWRSEFKNEVIHLLGESPRSYSALEAAYYRTTKHICQKTTTAVPEELVKCIEEIAQMRNQQHEPAGMSMESSYFQTSNNSALLWTLCDEVKSQICIEKPFYRGEKTKLLETFSLFYSKKQQQLKEHQTSNAGCAGNEVDLSWRWVIPPPRCKASRFYRRSLWSLFGNADILAEMLRNFSSAMKSDSAALMLFAKNGIETSRTRASIADPLAEQLLWHLVWTIQCNHHFPDDCVLQHRWWRMLPQVVTLLCETLQHIQEPIINGVLKVLTVFADSISISSGSDDANPMSSILNRSDKNNNEHNNDDENNSVVIEKMSVQQQAQQRVKEAIAKQQQNVMETMFATDSDSDSDSDSTSSASSTNSDLASQSDKKSSKKVDAKVGSKPENVVAVSTSGSGSGSSASADLLAFDKSQELCETNKASSRSSDDAAVQLSANQSCDISVAHAHFIAQKQCIICHGYLHNVNKDCTTHNTETSIQADADYLGMSDSTHGLDTSSVGSPGILQLAFVHKSNILKEFPADIGHENDSDMQETLLLNSTNQLYLTSCEHFVHAHCLHKHKTTLLKKRPKVNQHKAQLCDIRKNEFFCMKCSTICNIALPVLSTQLCQKASPLEDKKNRVQNTASMQRFCLPSPQLEGLICSVRSQFDFLCEPPLSAKRTNDDNSALNGTSRAGRNRRKNINKALNFRAKAALMKKKMKAGEEDDDEETEKQDLSAFSAHEAWCSIHEDVKCILIMGASILSYTTRTLLADSFTETVLRLRDLKVDNDTSSSSASSSASASASASSASSSSASASFSSASASFSSASASSSSASMLRKQSGMNIWDGASMKFESRLTDVVHFRTLLSSLQFVVWRICTEKVFHFQTSKSADKADNVSRNDVLDRNKCTQSQFGVEMTKSSGNYRYGQYMGNIFQSLGVQGHRSEFRKLLHIGGSSLLAILVIIGANVHSEATGLTSNSNSKKLIAARDPSNLEAMVRFIRTFFLADCERLLLQAEYGLDKGHNLFGTDVNFTHEARIAKLFEAAKTESFHQLYVKTSRQQEQDVTPLSLTLLHAHNRAAFYIFLISLINGSKMQQGHSIHAVATAYANPIDELIDICGIDIMAPLSTIHNGIYEDIVQRHHADTGYPGNVLSAKFNKIPPLLVLQELPNSFTDFYTRGGQEKCSCCNAVPVEPVMCLICGQTVCLRRCKGQASMQSSLPGMCTSHTNTVHEGCGLFIIVHTADILLIFQGHTISFPSPYIDRFGETLRRRYHGRPMLVDAKRMQMLRRMWSSHALTSTILRQRLTATRIIIYNYY